MTCSIPNRPFSFKSTYFSKKYPAITPQSAFASEGACANSTTTYQGTMYPLTVRYSHIHFQTLIHSVNIKCDSVKKPIMHRLWHRKEKPIMHRLWQCSIACGNANIRPILDKNDNAKFSRFRGSVDISSIISSLYFIGRFRQVFVLSELLAAEPPFFECLSAFDVLRRPVSVTATSFAFDVVISFKWGC